MLTPKNIRRKNAVDLTTRPYIVSVSFFLLPLRVNCLHTQKTVLERVKVRFHHHILATNLLTNMLTKLPHKQMSHMFVLLVSQKFVTNQIGLLQTHQENFESKFVIKFVTKM
jgi:hypothetical protein